ncbi:four-carbon acid sugar kinase family protein [Uliginosibacterium gangwonense]|uniref:four-carbon acid sugar kinase family protein n=1 Tax=Uliginosibacterium gangwonense TaxID=392736 RepID=UPI000363E6B9|nr:four-carbon acid sugar kinase family protein [Uliginosibacterium gangwonense]
MKPIHLLADDLTGALDSAAAFGRGVSVWMERPDQTAPRAPVECVATESRDIPASCLLDVLQPSIDWFKQNCLAFKKVDSLLRGNTFAEVALLAREGGFPGVVFAPAFPAQGRVSYGNRHWRQTAADQFEQIGTQTLSEAFAAHGLYNVGTSDETAMAGQGSRVWIPEIRTEADLLALAAQVDKLSSWMWCGSAGLAFALAQKYSLQQTAVAQNLADHAPGILISASFQPSFKRQWQILKAALTAPVFAEAGQYEAVAAAMKKFQAQPGFAMFDLSATEWLAPAEAAQRLQQQVEQLVSGLPRPGTLVAIGGDTLLALCKATGAKGFLADTPLRSGWGCSWLNGGTWDGVRCHSRSGAFGKDDDLLTMVQMIKVGALFHKDS